MKVQTWRWLVVESTSLEKPRKWTFRIVYWHQEASVRVYYRAPISADGGKPGVNSHLPPSLTRKVTLRGLSHHLHLCQSCWKWHWHDHITSDCLTCGLETGLDEMKVNGDADRVFAVRWTCWQSESERRNVVDLKWKVSLFAGLRWDKIWGGRLHLGGKRNRGCLKFQDYSLPVSHDYLMRVSLTA